jgi:predicted exporter
VKLFTTIRGRLWLWALTMVLMVAGFVAGVVPHFRVDTDILTLLPTDRHDADAEQALRTYTDQLGRRTLFLVEAKDLATAKPAAQAFADSLRTSPVFSRVQLDLDAGIVSGLQDYLPYRYGLLSDAQRQMLQTGQGQKLYEQALRSLYTPAGWMRPFSASEDPLGLLSGFVSGLRPPVGKAGPHDGVLAVVAADHADVLVIAETAGSAFSATVQEQAGPAIAAARSAGLKAGAAAIVGSGVILHAAEAARHAKTEMGLFSTIALVGCALLLLVTFRSLRPMFFGALAMGFGTIGGLGACYLAFGQVHMLTLVFGSSLIGTAVDYAVYYFADCFRSGPDAAAETKLRNVAAGILLGYMTTAMSYLALMAAPFPGLRQIALFSAVGLGVACACMLCLFPVFRVAGNGPPPPVPAFARWLLRLRWAEASSGLRLLAVVVAVAALAGILRIRFLDDVRALQIPPPDLLRQELRVREVLGQMPDSRFVLVRGQSIEEVLQREEALCGRLDALRTAGKLGTYLGLSSALPSLQRQQADRDLAAGTVYSGEGLLPRLMHQLGYDDDSIRKAITAAGSASLLTPELFFRSSISQLYRTQWLGPVGNGYASIVTLFDLSDVPALNQAASGLPGVRIIDKVGDISNVLRSYRRLALGLIAGVYVFIALALWWRYGWRDGMLTLLPAVGAAVLAIAVQSWLGEPVNLFNVLALLLVLGMGVDYAIFLRESREAMDVAILAVSVATAAAALSFGVLVLSTTPFIRSIGLTMAIGIVAASVLVVGLRPPALNGKSFLSETSPT